MTLCGTNGLGILYRPARRSPPSPFLACSAAFWRPTARYPAAHARFPCTAAEGPAFVVTRATQSERPALLSRPSPFAGRVWRGRRLYVVRRSFVLAVCPRVRDAFEAACRAAFKAEARRGEGDAPAAPTVARCSPAELNALKSQGACPAAAQCLDLVCFAFARGTAEALLTAGGGASASSAAAGAGGGAVVAGGAAADKLRELSIFANACAVLSYVGPLPLPECFMPGGMGDGAEGGEDDDDPVETADDAAWADGAFAPSQPLLRILRFEKCCLISRRFL